MAVRLRPAAPAEGGRLREIAVASKLHWGYAQEDVRRWVANGDFSPAGLRAKEFYVADADGVVIAFASLVAGEVAVLDDLWVEPGWIGKGVGATLFRAVPTGRRRWARAPWNGTRSRMRSGSTNGWAPRISARAARTRGAEQFR